MQIIECLQNGHICVGQYKPVMGSLQLTTHVQCPPAVFAKASVPVPRLPRGDVRPLPSRLGPSTVADCYGCTSRIKIKLTAPSFEQPYCETMVSIDSIDVYIYIEREREKELYIHM